MPALGAPTMAAKPARVRAAHALLSHVQEHRLAAALSASRLVWPAALRRRQRADLDLDQEDRLVLGAFAADLAVDRQGKSARLRPFLELRLGRPRRGMLAAQPLAPQALDGGRRRLEAGIEEDRAQQRLEHVGQDRGVAGGAPR